MVCTLSFVFYSSTVTTWQLITSTNDRLKSVERTQICCSKATRKISSYMKRTWGSVVCMIISSFCTIFYFLSHYLELKIVDSQSVRKKCEKHILFSPHFPYCFSISCLKRSQFGFNPKVARWSKPPSRSSVVSSVTSVGRYWPPAPCRETKISYERLSRQERGLNCDLIF